MKFLNSKTHGIIDYFLVFMLSISSFVFNYEEDSIHCRLLMVIGLLVLLVSLLTDFEFFLVKVFSFKTHLIIDIILGAILLTSPFFFELSEHTILPHIISGTLITGNGIFTRTSKVDARVSEIENKLQTEIITQD